MLAKHFWTFPTQRAIYTENDNGITASSLNALKKHLHALGKIEQVEMLMPRGEGFAESNTCFINVVGEYIQLDGFGWGYGGEGANGLAAAFKLIGLQIDIRQIAGWHSEHIRIDVSNPCVYPPCQCPKEKIP